MSPRPSRAPAIPTDALPARSLSAPGLALLLACALAVAYAPVWNAGWVWDDAGHLTAPELRGLSGLARIWTEPRATQQYYPLLHSLFWLEDLVFGRTPLAYHLANLALHTFAALALWRLLARLAVPGAYVIALVFALHPVQVESVAWISEQKNTLSACFYCAAWLAWLRCDAGRARGDTHLGWWALSFACACAAALSKTVTLTLVPAILLVTWWREGGTAWLARVRWLAPHFAVAVALGLTTAWLEVHVGGAEGELTFAQRVLVAGSDLWFYFAKLAWPLKQVFVYPRWDVVSIAAWRWLLPLGFVALLATLFAARARVGRGPFTALAFFAGTLAPALGFFDTIPFQFSFVADHFQYLACAGPIALACGSWAAWAERAPRRVPVFRAGVAALALALGVLSFRHARAFESEETLWRDTLAKNPAAWLAAENLAQLLNVAGRNTETLAVVRAARMASPERGELLLHEGIALQQLGQPAEAAAVFAELEGREPGWFKAALNLGSAELARGDAAAALAALDRALALEPASAAGHMLRGNALLALGRADESFAAYARASELDPGDANIWFNAGVAHAARHDDTQALAAYTRALELDPASHAARLNRAVVYWRTGRVAEARTEFERVAREAVATEAGARARYALEQLGPAR